RAIQWPRKTAPTTGGIVPLFVFDPESFATPRADGLTSDAQSAMVLLNRQCAYGALLFGLVGVLILGAWGGAKIGGSLFGQTDLAWWGGLLAGGLISLWLILPIGNYLD